MFKIDTKEIKQLEADLRALSHRSLPFATKQTINKAAFKARELAQNNIRNKMVARNKWTAGSVMVEQAKGLRIRRQEAFVGSTEDYMEVQEFGGVRTTTGKRGVPLPTSYGSGEGDKAIPRRRLPRKPNRLSNIVIKRGRFRAKTRAQKIVSRVAQAVKTRSRVVFLDLGRKQALFRVVGGSKKNPSKARLKMIYDLSRKTYRIPRTRWLLPAAMKAGGSIPRYYKDALLYQLRRLRTYKG